MAKIKYRYNPETLSYDIVTTSVKDKLKQLGIMFVVSILMSVIYFAIFSRFFDTPKEHILTNNLSEIKINYQMVLHDLNEIDFLLSDIQKRDNNIYRTVLESDPIPNSIRYAGFGGVDRYSSLEGYQNSELMITAAKHTDRILKQLYVQSISYDELISKAFQKEQMTLSRPAILPISKNSITSTSRFGMRLNPVLKVWMMHYGLDFCAKMGTPIIATGDGTVIKAEFNNGGYGNVIVIDHDFGYNTLYAHMQKMIAPVGSKVKRGQIIGTVGSTGRSAGPHVHYEVHKNGRQVNPIHYIYTNMSQDEYIDFVEQSNDNEDFFEDWDDEIVISD